MTTKTFNKILDEEVRPYLLVGLNVYRKRQGLSLIKDEQLSISVMGFAREQYIPVYSPYSSLSVCFLKYPPVIYFMHLKQVI